MSDETFIIHNPGNEARIDELFAFMSVDANGKNGVVASIVPGLGSTPLITGSRRLAEKMKPIAERVALATGKRVHLVRFTRVEGDMWRSGAPDE